MHIDFCIAKRIHAQYVYILHGELNRDILSNSSAIILLDCIPTTDRRIPVHKYS